ncbi:MAG: hypothetical protein ACYDHF_06510 [Candidatus Cryosericum sp.]
MHGTAQNRNLKAALALVVLVSLFMGVSSAHAAEPVVDFGFESGELSGWTLVSSPDAVDVIGAGAYTSPYWGSSMVVLGSPHYTGLAGGQGTVSDNASVHGAQPLGSNEISAQFKVTTPSIVFAYNAFTVDYVPFDRFGYVVTAVKSGTVVAEFSASAWGPNNGLLKSGGWQAIEVDTRQYFGQEVRVRFFSGGTSDTQFATWTYFDAKEVQYALFLTPPAVAFLNEAEGRLTSTNPISMIPVRVVPGSSSSTTLTLSHGGQILATSNQNGGIEVPVVLSDGEYELRADVVDGNGLVAKTTTKLMVDTHAPVVELPGVATGIHSATVNLSGLASDAVSGVRSVAVNGKPADLYVDGSFSSTISLKKGTNDVDVEAIDKLGNRSLSTWSYAYQPVVAVRPYVITMLLGGKDVSIDGSWETGTAAPMTYKGKVYLPAGAVLKLAGGTARYANGICKVEFGGRTFTVGVGGDGGTVMGGVYYLPMEYLRDVVGIDLAWDVNSQSISFTRWP